MVSEQGLKTFVHALQRAQLRGASLSSHFWVVGAGVSAAITGNPREATWLGLIRSLVEHIASNRRDFDENLFIKAIHDHGVDNFAPDSEVFWQTIYIITRCFGGEDHVKRWINQRMAWLETQVIRPELVHTIGSFGWPICTTNYDHMLSQILQRDARGLLDTDLHSIEGWINGSLEDNFVLHLHGRCSQPDALLFSREDYEHYSAAEAFRRRMDALFHSRPIFIGCKDTLFDPNISLVLQDRFTSQRSFEHEPIVLLRAGETIPPRVAVFPCYYGDQHADLLPFLEAARERLQVDPSPETWAVPIQPQPTPSPKPVTWDTLYWGRLAQQFRLLGLPDFRARDRRIELGLDDIYLALTFDARSSQERLEESRAFHAITTTSDDEDESATQKLFMRPPGRLQTTEEPVTLDNLLRRGSVCSVILGDPGSGKTTLIHWLARQCAIARQNERENLLVEAVRINPDADPTRDPVQIGPAWFPVIVSVAEYSRARPHLKVEVSRRLLRYAAEQVADQSRAAGAEIDIADAETRLNAEAAAGRLLFLVDGLDEDIQAEDRRAIVGEIEHLITWIEKPLDGTGNERRNRILVTSREAGYNIAPLSIDVPHYKVKALTRGGAQRLLDNLFSAAKTELAEGEASRLTELQTDLRRRLSTKANNLGPLVATPVLASALFTLQLVTGGQLPSDRRGLYAAAIDLYMRREAGRIAPLRVDEVANALREFFGNLAYNAFNSPESSLVSEATLRSTFARWAEARLALGDTVVEAGATFGPLIPRAAGAYAFVHRTFQEFLCAEHLSRPTNAFAELVHLAGMPSWSEPARLGLMIWIFNGDQTPRWSSDIEDLIQGSHLGNAFRPIALALAAAAESADVRDSQLESLAAAAIEILVRALPNWVTTPEDIAAALGQVFQKADRAQSLIRLIEVKLDAAAHAPSHQDAVRQAAVVARWIVALNITDPLLASALVRALPSDDRALEWPVTSALLHMLKPDLIRDGEASQIAKLSREELAELDKTPPAWLDQFPPTHEVEALSSRKKWLRAKLKESASARLLTAVLGGQRDYQIGRVEALYQHIAHFLQLPDERRQEVGQSLPPRWLGAAGASRARSGRTSGAPDTDYDLALYLDTDASYQLKLGRIPPAFSLSSCVFPSHYWPDVHRHLRQGRAAIATSSTLLRRVVDPFLADPLGEDERRNAHNLMHRLADASRRALSNLDVDAADNAIRSLEAPQQLAFIEALAGLAERLGHPRALTQFNRLEGLGPGILDTIERERLAALAGLFVDDRVYASAVWLDTRRGQIPLAGLCRSEINRNSRTSDLPDLPPGYPTPGTLAQALDELTALERFPDAVDLLSNEAAIQLATEAPESWPELAAVLDRQRSDNPRARSLLGAPDPTIDSTGQKLRPEQSPLLWRFRARVRRLGALSARMREAEEAELAAQISALPPGLLSAQAVELLAERALHVATSELIDAALSIEGLTPPEQAYLRLRLLPLILESKLGLQHQKALLNLISSLEDETVRADLLASLRLTPWLGKGMLANIESLLRRIADPLQRLRASGRPGAILAMLMDGPLATVDGIGGQALAPLVAYAQLEDMVAGEEPVISGLSAVLKALEHHDADSIVPAVIASSISSPRGLTQLWRRFAHQLNDASTARMLTAILNVSLEGLGPDEVPVLIAALSSEHDEVRARARALVLPRDHDVWLSASACGLETLLALRASALAAAHPATRVQVHWRLERMRLDSSRLASELCEIAEAEGPQSLVACRVLSSFRDVTDEAHAALAGHAPKASPQVRYAILNLIARSAFTRGSKDGAEMLIAPFLSQQQACEPDLHHIICTPSELVAVICAAHDPEDALAALRREHGRRLSDLFSPIGDTSSILAFGRTHFAYGRSGDERASVIVEAAMLLLSQESGPIRIASLLAMLLRESIEDTGDEQFIRSDLTLVLAAAAELEPARISAALEATGAAGLLPSLAAGGNSYPARRAAFVLMGQLFDRPGRAPSAAAIDALLAAHMDVADVIDAALTAAGRIRASSLQGLDGLRKAVRGRSAARAALAGRMLIAIARNQEATQDVRSVILRDLGEFVREPRSNRSIYFGRLDAATPQATTIREHLLSEFSAAAGGLVHFS